MKYALEIFSTNSGRFRATVTSEDGTQGVFCDAQDAGTAVAQAVKFYRTAIGEPNVAFEDTGLLKRRVSIDPTNIESVLREAIEQEGAVRIDYVDSSGASTKRTIYPKSLSAWSLGSTKIVRAWDTLRSELRSFRIDRIQRAEALED